MPRTTTQTKPKKVTKSTSINTEQEVQPIEAFPKNKKSLEVDETELIPGTEEKLDEDGMPITEDSEESESDEIGLGDEDFGDRWEE